MKCERATDPRPLCLLFEPILDPATASLSDTPILGPPCLRLPLVLLSFLGI